MEIIDSFLSEDECDFLIEYYEKYPIAKFGYSSTVILQMKDTSLFDLRNLWIRYRYLKKDTSLLSDLRKSWIRYFYLKRIQKKFPLKLNYDQLVLWPPTSFKDMHNDGEFIKENDWTCVCYLNDDFEGGETLIEDKSIKPKKGTLVVFPSKKMEHGVSLVKGKSRYTYISWWKEK